MGGLLPKAAPGWMNWGSSEQVLVSLGLLVHTHTHTHCNLTGRTNALRDETSPTEPIPRSRCLVWAQKQRILPVCVNWRVVEVSGRGRTPVFVRLWTGMWEPLVMAGREMSAFASQMQRGLLPWSAAVVLRCSEACLDRHAELWSQRQCWCCRETTLGKGGMSWQRGLDWPVWILLVRACLYLGFPWRGTVGNSWTRLGVLFNCSYTVLAVVKASVIVLLVVPVPVPRGFLSFCKHSHLPVFPLTYWAQVWKLQRIWYVISGQYWKFYRSKFMFCGMGLSVLCGTT